MLWPLYLQEKSPQYPMERRMMSQRASLNVDKRRKHPTSARNQTLIIQTLAGHSFH
jgi:hypothetical protein